MGHLDLSEAAQNISDTVKSTIQDGGAGLVEKMDHLPATLQHASQELVHVAEHQLELVKSIDRGQLLRTIARWAQKTEEQIGQSARKAQKVSRHSFCRPVVFL